MPYPRPFRILPLLLLLAAACADQATEPRERPEPDPDPPPVPLGVYQFTFSGIGGPEAGASSSVAPIGTGISAAMNPVTSGLVFELVSSSSFVEGDRGADGHRYFSFTYRVRNSTGAPVSNLTVIPVMSSATIPGTPFLVLRLPSGADAPAGIASTIVPTGSVVLGGDLTMRAVDPDVLQVFLESEVAAIALPAGYDELFPYGFMVRSVNTPASRTLAPAASDNDFGGLLTLSFRIPLQPGGTPADPRYIVFQALVVQDTETRLTESIEEGADTAGVRRLRELATAMGATTTTVLAGSSAVDPAVPDYPGQRQICTVRTAGTAASPVTYITNPAAYAKILLLRPGEVIDACSAYFRSGTPARPATNVPFTLTLSAMDRYGNLKTAVVDTVRVEQVSGPPATFEAPAALSGGQADIDVTYSDYGNSLLRAVGRRNRGLQPILVAGVTRTWTAGAATTDWFTNGNWSPAAVPMHLDSVVIPSAPAGGTIFPQLTANVNIGGVSVQDNPALINLSSFNLTATADVQTTLSGQITASVGRVFLAGVAKQVGGNLPRTTVTGTYSLTSNLAVNNQIRVQGGRLRNTSFRVRINNNP